MDQVDKYRKVILNKKIGVMVFMWVLIFGGFSTYMIEMSKLSVAGFKVTELERGIKSLEESNKKLTLKLADMKKMASIDEFSKSKNMVAIEKVDYINLTSSVAMR